MKLKVIVDASIIFSSLLGSKKTRKILNSELIELYVPDIFLRNWKNIKEK